MGESGRIGKPSNLHRSSTSDTFFRVLPLTLQPIVENAVKHGRDPLHISIRTRETVSVISAPVFRNQCRVW